MRVCVCLCVSECEVVVCCVVCACCVCVCVVCACVCASGGGCVINCVGDEGVCACADQPELLERRPVVCLEPLLELRAVDWW